MCIIVSEQNAIKPGIIMQNKQFFGRKKPLKTIWSESTKTSIVSHWENNNTLGGVGGYSEM